jgi:acyl-coenzyme A thioesterase PaaI-like protein
MAKKMTPGRLKAWVNWWPPFLFGGVQLLQITDDWRYARVQLKLRWYNRNYVGTHFGGLLFAMTDPFWMILVMECLGPDYVVWDKAGKIDFISPGRSDVHAEFRVRDEDLSELKAAAAGGDKVLRWFTTEVRGPDDTLVARVQKQLYVRLKKPLR